MFNCDSPLTKINKSETEHGTIFIIWFEMESSISQRYQLELSLNPN